MTPRSRVVLRDVSKSYGSVAAVRDFTLEAIEGEILALLGPSGCGKTTALRLVAGLERPDRGRIEIDGRVVADAASGAYVPPERRGVGLVFQDYALFPHLTVAKNLAYGVRGPNGADEVRRVAALAGLEGYLDRFPHQLSGGQQQRVALARALAPRPNVMLLDEPFSNLDARRRATMRAEVRAILKATATASIFVTHDQEEALTMGDRLAVMQGGTLHQVGTPERVFHSPANKLVAAFLGDTSFIRGVVTEDGLDTPFGHLPQRVAAPVGREVELLVRPDDVDVLAAPDGTARIERRAFRGMHQHYRVVLPSGERLSCLTDHCVRLAPGDPVAVVVRACHPLACFVDGVNVTTPHDGYPESDTR